MVGACAALVLASGPDVPVYAAPVTSFTATTTLAQHVLPQPAAVGEWSVVAGGTRAALHVEAMNPSPAVTRIEAGWVSPFVRSRGRCLGRYDFYYYSHRLVLPPPHVTDVVRYREQGGRWSRWLTEFDEDYRDTEPDMAIGSGQRDDCVVVLPRVPRRAVQLEIRRVAEYPGTHRIREDLVVSVP